MSSSGLSNAAGSRNGRYYMGVFNQFENAQGAIRPSWNWGAFLCSSAWFFYRRMFVLGAINLTALLAVVLPWALHLTTDEAGLVTGALGLYVAATFLLLPVVANWLYYGYLKRRLEAGGKTAPDTASFFAAAAAGALAAAASIHSLVIATSTDYEVRVHVVDAMLAVAPYKSAVETVVKQKGAVALSQGDLPAMSGARPHPGVKLAELAPGGVVRLAFTGFRHINGRWVEFVPTLTDKMVEWRCFNIDMPERELPTQCRVKRPTERKS